MGILKSIYENLFSENKEKELILRIPKSDFYRTELLCKCVEDDIEDSFLIEHFLMCLYLDFVRNSIKIYDLNKVYTILSKDFKNRDKKIKLSNGNKDIDVVVRTESCIKVNIIMERESMRKGELILFEIEEEFGVKISFEELLEKLWIGFIREYKSNNKKVNYSSLINIIERVV